MTVPAPASVLDADLRSLAGRAASPDPTEVPIPLEVLAAHRAAHEPAPSPPDRIEAKLVVAAGEERRATEWVTGHHGEIVSSGEQVLVANLAPDALGRLDECPGIRRAEAPRELVRQLDEARGAPTLLDSAVAAHGLSGQGVVIGIVDSGVDWRHDDFRNPDGSSRIELFAHAVRPAGSMVSQLHEFGSDQIDAALTGSGNVPLGDPGGHGTHCAAIAAGNGRALHDGRLRGVAPAAALVAVRSEPLYDTHTIHGIRRTFEVAGDRPAVVTLSIGGQYGPHDGTSAIENVIARESGPGRIVVVAAGNDGDDRIHFAGDLVAGEDLAIRVRMADPQLQWVDVWVPRGDLVDVSIETPDGVAYSPDGSTTETVFGVFEAYWQEDPVNRDQNLTMFVAQAREGHTWTIRLRASEVVHGRVHAWAGTRDRALATQLFPDADGDDYSIGMPATEERCLAVGSFISRNRFDTVGGTLSSNLVVGELSPFSSLGPTRSGALKPDIAAPGQFVTSALAQQSRYATEPQYQPRHHPSGRYLTIQGTSMAAPFVAGVVALMLEREPRLTPEEIQQRFRATARRDRQTGRVWGRGFGFGKIDVAALLDYRG